MSASNVLRDLDPSPSKPAAPLATVLVADDDRLTRELLANILRSHGYVVETCEDGQEAVERVSRGGIHLALLDIMMPRLSGLEACRLLKGMTNETFLPVVLVTIKTDSASRVEGLKIGADDYVCKPFEEKELVARVEAMLRIKRLHDHVAQARQKLEQMSVHDELTGLYNYRYLHTRLSEEFKRAERYHDPLACAFIDIDQLKARNDSGTRQLGDHIIRSVAELMRACVRDVDVIARYGGEEFLIVLPSTHFGGAVTVAERIWRDVTERRFTIDAQTFHNITVSIGTKDALLRAADGALQQAKRDGGNRICVFQQQGYIYTPALGPPSSSRPPQKGVGGGSAGGR